MGDEMHQRNVACTSLLLRLLQPASRAPRRTRRSWKRHSNSSPQRPVLFQRRDGDGQIDPRPGARHRGFHRGHRHVPQRHGLRHPRRRARRPMVHGAGRDCRAASISRASAPPTPIRTSATRRSSKRSGWAPSRWRRPPRCGLRRRRRLQRRGRLHPDHERARARAQSEMGIPALEFAGASAAIDIRRVVETGIAPAINTGIAHRRAGVGQVGRASRAHRSPASRRRWRPSEAMSFVANRSRRAYTGTRSR